MLGSLARKGVVDRWLLTSKQALHALNRDHFLKWQCRGCQRMGRRRHRSGSWSRRQQRRRRLNRQQR
ncbi:hypothetical protein Pan216_32640 [Planctomycetes bacterium Pan216]|uniref:Uncharacterized protein n=1 Tax=Kolteria novifilia TaxID=2527975 RepID=A0A518B5Z8_9BACT|nr:hypothetical protein Pan216_32640 [Planctomycetes bacterium Pan216]